MNCTECRAEVKRVVCFIDPQKIEHVYVINCGHRMTETEAREAWRLGISIGPVPEINGASLINAERSRVLTEEGHTLENDAELTGDQLAWAAWCLLDRAAAENPPEQAPPVWPLPRDRWPRPKTPLRWLIIAGQFIAAEIDRRLAAGEGPHD